MPRKPRITAVPVEQVQPEEGLMVARDEKTDAEQMTEILQEVQQEPKEEPKETVSDAPGEVKPKAKRASRAKPPVGVPGTKEEPKSDEKVACTDCSHGQNCGNKKPKTKTEDDREAITEAMIEHHVRTRSRAERATRRETMMNQLMQTAF